MCVCEWVSRKDKEQRLRHTENQKNRITHLSSAALLTLSESGLCLHVRNTLNAHLVESNKNHCHHRIPFALVSREGELGFGFSYLSLKVMSRTAHAHRTRMYSLAFFFLNV